MNSKKLKILALEPYYGGSHKQFLDGYISHSKHEFELLTMSARKWKWRMRGAAVHFAEIIANKNYDVLFVSDFVNLAELSGLIPSEKHSIPKVVYFHENQLTYPVQVEDEKDYQYVFTNISTCLAADAIVFNSEFHRQSVVRKFPIFLKRMPDYIPEKVDEKIMEKSSVIHPGIIFDNYRKQRIEKLVEPVILWSHRWEFDKNPEDCFAAFIKLKEENVPFKLVVVGEHFRNYPFIFDEAKEVLSDRIIQWGYAESKEDYLKYLSLSDIVVSTAIHEFFGIAMVEAIASGCYPILPNRLAYPEILTTQNHDGHLYEDYNVFYKMLKDACLNIDKIRQKDLSEIVRCYNWKETADQMDNLFLKLYQGNKNA